MAISLPVRACLLAVLLVATTAAANRNARLHAAMAQSQRATGDEDAPPTTPAHGRYHSELEQQQLPELPQGSAQLDPAATATAARLVSALLRALAAPPPTESPKLSPNVDDDSGDIEDPWRGAARELAGDLLADGRLSTLLGEPTVAAAMSRELRGLRCEAAAVDEHPPHPPQRPDSGAASAAPLLGQPPLSGGSAIDPRRTHAGAHIDEGDAAAGSLRPRPPPPIHKKQDESGGGPLLRAPRSAGASCDADGDCPLGQYCSTSLWGSCDDCSSIAT